MQIPHVSVNDLLTKKGERKNIIDAYKYYSLTNTEYVRKRNIELYPRLQKFEKNKSTLYNATQNLGHLSFNATNSNEVHEKEKDIFNNSGINLETEAENDFIEDCRIVTRG